MACAGAAGGVTDVEAAHAADAEDGTVAGAETAIGNVKATQARQEPATWFQQFTHTERSHDGHDRMGDPPM